MPAKRRRWTIKELNFVRRIAQEDEMSISRAASALRELYGINVTVDALGAFASRYKIKFRGKMGAPYGNQNRKGKFKQR